MSFQIHGLSAAAFAPLFELSDKALGNHNITRHHADAPQGYPCRVSLCEAPEGEELLLLNYKHLTFPSPYCASHAIYVAKDSTDASFDLDDIPQSFTLRPLSLRAFTSAGIMLTADLADDKNLSERLNLLLSKPDVAFVHIHNAKQGCYAALATRPDEFQPEWCGVHSVSNADLGVI